MLIRGILTTKYFDKSLLNFIKSHNNLRNKTLNLIDRLSKDPFVLKNKTHKLSGNLSGMYSASIDNKYRIVFLIGTEAITLINIGSHNDVYKNK
jgi:addiction module RelE/StbE family toxin